MAPLPTRQLTPLTRRFQVALNAIGERSTPALQRAWAGLGSYDEDQIAAFARKANPVMATAKAAAVRHAVGYYSLAAGVRPVAIAPADVPVVANLREPFIAVWSSLKNGGSFEASVAAGANRTDAVVRNLVSSSSRRTGDLLVARAGLRVVGWERVADANACPWCEELDGTVFDTAEAADFGHDRCNCSAQPIYA